MFQRNIPMQEHKFYMKERYTQITFPFFVTMFKVFEHLKMFDDLNFTSLDYTIGLGPFGYGVTD